MKKAVLIVSHEGSGSSALCEILNRNPRVQFTHPNLVYNHPEVVESLTNHPHKLSNSAAVWLDEILHNFYFTNKAIYQFCRFIYFIREPKPTLNMIVDMKANAPGMTRYYCYRLRRICEMARSTPGSMFLTWDDVYTGRAFPMIEKFLGLKEPLVLDQSTFPIPKPSPFVTTNMVEACQNAYERYFYYLKNLPMLKKFEFG